MSVRDVDHTTERKLLNIFATKPPWLEHVYRVRIVDFIVGNPADEGSTYIKGTTPRPDEQVRSAVFVQTSEADGYPGVLYEPHRWPGSRRHRINVSQRKSLVPHEYLDSEALIGFIYKKDFEKNFAQVIESIPPPDPGIMTPTPEDLPDADAQDDPDLPPRNSIE
ncbi:hypothetical protein ACHAPT_011708 [Fusarium lateritium]